MYIKHTRNQIVFTVLALSFFIIAGASLACQTTPPQNQQDQQGQQNQQNQQNQQASTAEYTITFTASWSRDSHPTDYPSSAHFSSLIGMTHSSSTSLFTLGSAASPGIESMAETGGTSTLKAEIDAKITAGTAGKVISGSGTGATGTVSVDVLFDQTHPMASVVTMIAPSPDWFVAASNVLLFENGAWVASKELTVEVLDAGTESGNTFSLSNPAETGVIQRLTTGPLVVNGVIAPMGKVRFVKK